MILKRIGALGALLFCLAFLPGCVVTAAGVAGALSAAAGLVTTGAEVVAAVRASREAIAERESLGDKLSEFRRQYCARAELRDQAREDLTAMLVAAGVPEDEAAVKAATAKSLGLRICGGG